MTENYSYPKEKLYGTLVLECKGDYLAKCLICYLKPITQISDNISVTMNTIPLPTYTAENAFCYDTGVQGTYTFSFTRLNPEKDNINDNQTTDQSLWSNKKFKENLSKMVNRWQMESDGCKMVYMPPRGSDRPSIPYSAKSVIEAAAEGSNVTLVDSSHDYMLNAYIKTITFEYNGGYPDMLTGQVALVIGTMKGKRTKGGVV